MFHHKFYLEDVKRVATMPFCWEKLSGKRVLITGSTGMTASMLIDVLMYRNLHCGDEISVIAVSKSKDRIHKRFADYLDVDHFFFQVQDVKKNLPELGVIDYFFHGSGYTIPDAFETDPIGTVTADLIGTQKMLSYASTHKAEKIIFFSSVEIYGTNRGDVGRFSEEYCGYLDSNSLKSGFAESKRVGESLTRAYGNQYGIHVNSARFCKIYGPSMSLDGSKSINRYIRQAIHSQNVVLTGNREEIYSYCYCADAVTGLLQIAFYGEDGEAYNIADNREPLNAKLLAEKIAELTGTKVVEDDHVMIPFQNNTSYANNYIMDAGKIEKLGWKPQTTLSDGLKRTLQALAES